MKKFIIILLGIIVYCSCQDDNNSNRVKPEVSFLIFQDPRDSKTYKCITIGGQTWMAENLKYRSPRGSMDGCYTYGEENMRAQDIVINQELWADSIRAGITRGEFEGTVGTMKLADILILWLNYFKPDSYINQVENSYGATFPDAVISLRRIYNNLYPQALMEVSKQFFEKAESTNGHYSSKYGFLYTYEGALQAVPDGWRLPTDDDWKKLEETLGMSVSEINMLDEWRGSYEGDLLKEGEQGIGFNAGYAGARVYGSHMYGGNFYNKDVNAYFWSATRKVESDTVDLGITRILFLKEDRIMRSSSKLSAAYSVRCIKE